MNKITPPAGMQNTEPDFATEYIDEEGHTLLDYWRIVVRHKWGILSITFAAMLIGVLTAFSATPIYRASATLLVEPAQPKFVGVQSLDSVAPLMLFYETQYEIIRSRTIAETAVDKFGLLELDDSLETDNSWLQEQTQSWFGDWQPDATNEPDENDRRKQAVKRLQANLSVRGGQKSQIVVISYESTSAKMAAKTANSVAQAYSEYGMESRLATVKEATAWLSDRLQGLRAQMEQSEAALQAFQSRESMVDTENRRQHINIRMANLTTELVRAQAARSEVQIRYRQIHRLNEKGNDLDALVPLLNSALVNRLSEQHALLKRKFSELSERYGEKHPKIIAAKADLKEASRRLEAEISQAVDNIRKEYQAAKSKEREAQRQLEQQQKEMRSVTGKGFQLVKFEREVEANRQLYDMFLARFKEVDTAGDSNLTNVRVIDQAQVPVIPYKPNKKRVVIVSLVLGLFFGIAVAFLREKLDNTFKRNSDIEERLLLPVLTELALIEKQTDKPFVPERHMVLAPRTGFSEAINNVRTGILFSNLDDPVKTLLITSTITDEGKTTLASNLAISFSQLGRTLLIDADMRKTSNHHPTSLEKGAGFSGWLLGTHTLQECYTGDKECANLFIMVTGKLPPNPLELLSSKTFRNSFENLKKEFEYIIFDTPPVLPVSDPIVLGHLVDAVIFSVKFDATTYPMAQEAVKRLRANNIEPVGAVLSMVDTKKMQSYYGKNYYGGYYGGYYGSYGEQPKA